VENVLKTMVNTDIPLNSFVADEKINIKMDFLAIFFFSLLFWSLFYSF